jgi:hypothetical protein
MPDIIVRCDYCGYDMEVDRIIPLQMGRKVDDVYIVKPCKRCSTDKVIDYYTRDKEGNQ